MTYLVVRAIYPRFIPEEIGSTTAENDLAAVRRRVTWNSGMLGLAPLLAIFALALVQSEPFYFTLLALLGALSFLIALGLKPVIQADIDDLKLAVRPTEQLLGSHLP